MSKLGACISVLAAASVSAGLVGCQSDEPAPSNRPLAALENELIVAQGSFGGALDEAKACVDDFKACREADGADCVDDLKACLPAPEIPEIEGVEEAKACFEDFQACQESGSADCIDTLKACLPAPSGFTPPLGGGAAAGGRVGGLGFFGFGRGFLPVPGASRGGVDAGSTPARIGAAVDPAALAACKDSVTADASGGSDPAAIGDAFKACIADAFSDLFADVCGRIREACDGATDTTLCDRLSDACTDPALTP